MYCFKIMVKAMETATSWGLLQRVERCVRAHVYEKVMTYCSAIFGRLSRLSTLLPNWRQWCTQGGNIVRGEATVKLSAPVV